MKASTLLIVIALLEIGAGGKFAYDAYQDYQYQKNWEKVLLEIECSTCAAHKKELKLMMEENAKRSRLEDAADPDAE